MNASSPENHMLPNAGREPVRVVVVRQDLVTIETGDGPIMKNEVGYICVGEERLKAEVLRVHETTADMQVFEDTEGVRIGHPVD